MRIDFNAHRMTFDPWARGRQTIVIDEKEELVSCQIEKIEDSIIHFVVMTKREYK